MDASGRRVNLCDHPPLRMPYRAPGFVSGQFRSTEPDEPGNGKDHSPHLFTVLHGSQTFVAQAVSLSRGRTGAADARNDPVLQAAAFIARSRGDQRDFRYLFYCLLLVAFKTSAMNHGRMRFHGVLCMRGNWAVVSGTRRRSRPGS